MTSPGESPVESGRTEIAPTEKVVGVPMGIWLRVLRGVRNTAEFGDSKCVACVCRMRGQRELEALLKDAGLWVQGLEHSIVLGGRKAVA